MKYRILSFLFFSAFLFSEDLVFELDFDVKVEPGTVYSDMGPSLSFGGNQKITANTGIGYFTYDGGSVTLLDLGLTYYLKDFLFSPKYEYKYSELLFSDRANAKQNGVSAEFGMNTHSDLKLFNYSFWGKYYTDRFDSSNVFYNITTCKYQLFYNLINSVQVIADLSLLSDLHSADRIYALELSLPIRVNLGKFLVTPRLMYLNRSQQVSNTILDDSYYDFSRFTFGMSYGSMSGDAASVIEVEYRYFPFEYSKLKKLNNLFLSCSADSGMFLPRNGLLENLRFISAPGLGVGVVIVNLDFKLEAAYNTEAGYVWAFSIHNAD